MICECCKESVGRRRAYNFNMQGTRSALVCDQCFEDLLDTSRIIRDASGTIAWSVVADEDIDPVPVMGGDEEIRMSLADVGEDGDR